jgi:hypothetical protein
MQPTTVGLDVGKNVFQVPGVDAQVWRRRAPG